MLSDAVIRRVLDAALSNGADFAELFAEDTFSCRMALNSSRIKQSVSGRDAGAGIRLFYGTSVLYAYTAGLDEQSLLNLAAAAAAAGKGNGRFEVPPLSRAAVGNLHKVSVFPASVSKQERADFLHEADRLTRRGSALISQVDASLGERHQKVLIANSEGLVAADERVYSRFALNAVASKDAQMQTGSVSPGAMAGFEFIRGLSLEELAEECAFGAVTMLSSAYAPAGIFPVVIDNGFGGVIFHEACGHALETTAVAKNASVFAGKIGEVIASECVSAIDDGTLPNEWGSINVDDEGMKSQRTVLIENGVLKSYLSDRLGSMLTGCPRTGSGRRESYRYAPTSRMRNTFIAPGSFTLEELIASVDDGIYARKMGGGSVQPGTGDFNFAVTEGYRIRKGKLAEAVRGATLIGNGAETLKQISMTGNNFKLAAGMCGSESGSVPTHVGQGAIRVDAISVGGRE